MVWPGTERPLRSVITTGFAWVRWLGDTTDDILRHTTSTVQERIPPSIKTEGDDIHSGPLNGPLTIELQTRAQPSLIDHCLIGHSVVEVDYRATRFTL
jgi:hypothetical protein